MKRKLSTLVVCLGGLFLGGTASAQDAANPKLPTLPGVISPSPIVAPNGTPLPQQTVPQRIDFLLRGYEYFPTRADLDQVAPAAVVAAELRAAATNPQSKPTRVTRAIDALGYYDDAETIALLETLATRPPDEGLDFIKARVANLARHHAILSLAKAKKENAVGTLAPLLDDPDLQIQLSVISALGKHGGEAGKEVLTAFRRRSENPRVMHELKKFLGA